MKNVSKVLAVALVGALILCVFNFVTLNAQREKINELQNELEANKSTINDVVEVLDSHDYDISDLKESAEDLNSRVSDLE